jgi:hypothetical protein
VHPAVSAARQDHAGSSGARPTTFSASASLRAIVSCHACCRVASEYVVLYLSVARGCARTL